MLIGRFKHLAIPMIAGNIFCGIAFFAFVSNPPYDGFILFLSLTGVAFVFLLAGMFAAISHKQTVSSFSTRQSVVDGFFGGFLSSLVFLVLLSSALVIWAVVPVPFMAGLIGALGGGLWGIVYKLFFAKKNSPS